jgi:hypothetical protein
MIWGWGCWFRLMQPRTLPSILSLIGFTLATASGLLAVSSVLYAHSIGSFPFYDPFRRSGNRRIAPLGRPYRMYSHQLPALLDFHQFCFA